MAYLTKWRLRLGAEILQSSGDSVAEVAAAVGYVLRRRSSARSNESLIVLLDNFAASVRAHWLSILRRARRINCAVVFALNAILSAYQFCSRGHSHFFD